MTKVDDLGIERSGNHFSLWNCLSHCQLSLEEFDSWAARFRHASASLDEREEKLIAAAETIERDMVSLLTPDNLISFLDSTQSRSLFLQLCNIGITLLWSWTMCTWQCQLELDMKLIKCSFVFMLVSGSLMWLSVLCLVRYCWE
jgi:hypothetical protein